jgi:transcription-repair coupling factor (superfamily II helicase)
MLGTRQSGHIAAVGFTLYPVLAQAVRISKGEGRAPR